MILTKTKIIEIPSGAEALATQALTKGASVNESMAPVFARVSDAVETFFKVA